MRAGGYRLAAPPSASLIRWPAGFGTCFAIFVDTEEEFDWAQPFSRDAQATTATAALPAAHTRLASGGATATYLADHPVATNPGAIEALRSILAGDPKAAIGAQLHPWVNPPETADVESFAGNLPLALEQAKLAALTNAITAAFGRSPLAYRAGRYGIGPATDGLLATLGYRLDTSVRARYDYRAIGGPDFSAVGSAAWRTPAGLVELPLTCVFTGALRRWGGSLYPILTRIPRGAGIAARLKALSRVALTPEAMPLTDVLEAIAVAQGEGLRLLNFSFHSPSLVPGHTPYVRDAADLAGFWHWWDVVLAELARRGIGCASLDEILEAAG